MLLSADQSRVLRWLPIHKMIQIEGHALNLMPMPAMDISFCVSSDGKHKRSRLLDWLLLGQAFNGRVLHRHWEHA